MGKSGNKKGGGSSNQGGGGGLTLRQQIHGSNQKNKIGGTSSNGISISNSDRRSILKTKHLEKLGLWAADVSIPSLGALFGQRLASSCESLGTPVDPSLVLCQRCESILQPGSNCTVRIEKNGSKKKKGRKSSSGPPKNNVVYTCNFCSHRNLKRGTSKSHMKEILPPKPKKVKSDEKQSNLVKSKVDEGKLEMTNVEAVVCPENMAGLKEDVAAQICSSSEKTTESGSERGKITEEPVPSEYIPIEISETKFQMNSVIGKDVAAEKIPATPLNKMPVLLLDSKRKKRTRSHNKQVANESNSPTPDSEKVSTTSNKRRRKSWSSLKELAEANERKNEIGNLKIPFCL